MASTTSVPPGLLEEKCRRLENQISTMKNVAHLRKSLLELRERQVKDLISKMKSYEVIVTEGRESRNNLSARLESAEVKCTQLTDKLNQNQQALEDLKQNYESKVTTLIGELEISEKRNQQLSDQLNCAQLRITEVTNDVTLDELNKKLEDKDRLARDLQYQMKKIWERNKALSYQMTLLNNLFTETEGVTIDFEKIKAIGDIVRESQVLSGESDDEMMSDDILEGRLNSFDYENILETIEKSENVMPEEIPGEESCYKSVDTKRGPQLVLSVSRTFIKLKDLILEKKSLQKEIDTLKSLNTKLESKVDKQEHRLYRVTLELNKTWSLVSKLKQQHKKLYNSEAVLRYELQEKRILLERLKTELSASRDKWRRVRQKNSQSQIEWEKLRDEFEQRKQQSQSSQESGTFSEVMSVSSVENDEAAAAEVKRKISKVKRISRGHSAGNESEDEADEGAEEDELEGSARTQSSLEDEHYQDPLEELVSNLVADIENEAETQEESSQSPSVAVAMVSNANAAPAPSENASNQSPSSLPPDFEERLKRRAERLRNLEEQCHVLHKKLHASTVRSETLTSKLDALHEHYGPAGSGSSTETTTPSDDQQNKQNGEASQNQEEVDVDASHPQSSSRNDDEVSTTSTDAAYVSGTENSVREDSIADAKNSPETTSEDNNATSPPPPERGDDVLEENKLIETSENSAFNAPPTTSLEENKDDAKSSDKISINEDEGNKSVVAEPPQESQGHSGNIEIRNDATTLLTVAVPNDIIPCPPLDENTIFLEGEIAQTSTATEGLLECASDSSSVQCPSSVHPNDVPLDENEAVSDITITTTQSEEQSHRLSTTEVEHSSDFPVANNATDSQIEESAESQQGGAAAEQQCLVPEEPLPIQETVIQHFPSPSEEEANEFAPVQIRPEFLRILQEADEATNNIDSMPSLLTITHSVALLRLDPELPPERTIGDENRTEGNGRSLSESLRIEIPQQSPSPPPTNNSNRGRHRRRPGNSGSGGDNETVPTDSQNPQSQQNNEQNPSGSEEKEEELLPAYAKDPSFLSRMIIKQLPKRLQLLKNENHTLQMETAEAKMRMKDMTRQLSREVDKQQQLSMNLDTQIEEKHLIEFELREEIEKKEKVIEELQMEIDESKQYVDELKKEKEEADGNLRVLVEEKWDMEQPKEPLDSVKNCNNCKRPFFLLTRRKFYCKLCGKVFCKDCAIPREPNQRSSKRPRLCTRCHFRKQRLTSFVNSYKKSQPSAAEQHN